MLRLRRASAVLFGLCNRHRNSDHCSKQVMSARCWKGTRSDARRSPASRGARRITPASGGAGRAGEERLRGRAGMGEGRGEGPPAPGLVANLCKWPDLRPRAPLRAGRTRAGGAERTTRREAVCPSAKRRASLRSRCPRASKNSFFSVCLVGFSGHSPQPQPAPTKKNTRRGNLGLYFP